MAITFSTRAGSWKAQCASLYSTGVTIRGVWIGEGAPRAHGAKEDTHGSEEEGEARQEAGREGQEVPEEVTGSSAAPSADSADGAADDGSTEARIRVGDQEWVFKGTVDKANAESYTLETKMVFSKCSRCGKFLSGSSGPKETPSLPEHTESMCDDHVVESLHSR